MIALVVAAIVRRGVDVLLIREEAEQVDEPYWSVPSGLVGPGELVTEALARIVQDATGLRVASAAGLIYTAQCDHPTAPYFLVALEVRAWYGSVNRPEDDARFEPPLNALLRLDRAPLRVIREPLTAYLRGEAQPGAAYCYRQSPAGETTLVAR
ncbi:MAG: NUDIX domain-containing protein, partial [Dehalococcoidia bacterium]|nr:NUDIX domain-containing protein [Dehalococcoidia bacterium]